MNILIVDDSADNRLLLETLLEDAGYSFVSAPSANEAYQHLKMHDPGSRACGIDCILMDIMMPDITGIEATRAIKSHEALRDIPIIMVTAKSEDLDLIQAFEAGAMDYVTKPIHETQLMTRLRSALAMKRETEARKARERELTILRDQLLQKNTQLEMALHEIQNDLAAAGKVQKGLLPQRPIGFANLTTDYYFEPCNTIGGDLMNVIQINPDHIGFYVLDVAGHGTHAALQAVAIHRLLSAWGGGPSLIRLASGDPCSPKEVVTRLNAEFPMSAHASHLFTITYAVLNICTGVARYVRAGHTPLVIQSSTGEFRILENGNLLVGMFPDAEYEEFEITLGIGDRIFLYSDGIPEARLSTGELFGEERFFNSVKSTAKIPLPSAISRVIRDLKEWLGPTPLVDDATFLGIERTGSSCPC